MKVIGYKKTGITAMYFVVAIIGLIIIIVSYNTEIMLLIFGLIITAISGYLAFDILTYPNEIIKKEGEKLYLPKGIIINIQDIITITHVCARAKHHTYKWGTIYIKTNSNKYKCKYVENCEEVCDTLKAVTNYYDKLDF